MAKWQFSEAVANRILKRLEAQYLERLQSKTGWVPTDVDDLLIAIGAEDPGNAPSMAQQWLTWARRSEEISTVRLAAEIGQQTVHSYFHLRQASREYLNKLWNLAEEAGCHPYQLKPEDAD